MPYDALPDWFLAFDIFDTRSGRFWAVARRNEWLQGRGIVAVPEVARGRFRQNQLHLLLGQSRAGHVRMEGIYLRREKDGYLLARAKLVTVAFRQQIEEHWTRHSVVPNRLALVRA